MTGFMIILFATLRNPEAPVNYETPAISSTNAVSDNDDSMTLIPAGEFQMGDNLNNGDRDERPIHTVYVDAFYIDKYEVTNAQYRKFVKATGYRHPTAFRYVNEEWQVAFEPWADKYFKDDNMPVVCVNWDDAMAYCEWAGKRLPTEAEWEKSARDGMILTRLGLGNFADKAFSEMFPHMNCLEIYNDNYVYISPVGLFDANRYGLYDMMGNVWEWCSDWYGKNYYSKSPSRNPQGPNSGTYRIVRGGAWYSPIQDLRVSSRGSADPSYWYIGVGFRCAKSVLPTNAGL